MVLRGCGEAWTVFTNMALSLGQMLWQGERALKKVRECCYIDPVPTAKNSDGVMKHVNGLARGGGSKGLDLRLRRTVV